MTHPVPGLVLDSQGLTEAALGRPIVRAMIRSAEEAARPVIVPAVTLAEVLRGHPRDAQLHRALKKVQVDPVTEQVGRAAGELLGRTGRKDTVDAVVVATATALPGRVVIVTSDPTDMAALIEGAARVGVVAV